MCETKNAKKLRSTEEVDLKTLALTTADAIDALVAIQKQLQNIPVRSEIREMIQEGLSIHAATCDHARNGDKKAEEPNEFHVGGKIIKLEAKGKAGVFVGAVLGIAITVLLIASIPHLGDWLPTLFGR